MIPQTLSKCGLDCFSHANGLEVVVKDVDSTRFPEINVLVRRLDFANQSTLVAFALCAPVHNIWIPELAIALDQFRLANPLISIRSRLNNVVPAI